MRKLTVKQQKFVESYVGPANGNGTKAAALAGYRGNGNTLHSVGVENLRKPAIAAAVAERLEASLEALGADEILAELSRIAMDRDPTMRTADRLKALELLGRYHKLFTDKLEHGGDVAFAMLHSMSLEQKADRITEIVTTARLRSEVAPVEP